MSTAPVLSSAAPKPRAKIELLGTRIDLIDSTDLNRAVDQAVASASKAVILNVNAHALNLAHEQPWFRELLNQAAIVHCDGFGVQLAARIARTRVPQRVPVTEWIWDLARHCAVRRLSIFLLGGAPGVAEVAAANLMKAFPGLVIAGTQHGFYRNEENDNVVALINRSRAHVLIVCFGMPIQERWIKDNLHALTCSAYIAGGGVFDFVSSLKPRAPQWMIALGCEWLFRLSLEPKRLFRRYIIGNPLFLYRILAFQIGRPS